MLKKINSIRPYDKVDDASSDKLNCQKGLSQNPHLSLLTFNVEISHRLGRLSLNDLSEKECNLVERICRLKEPNLLLISPSIKKGTQELLSDTVTTDAMHIPDPNINKCICGTIISDKDFLCEPCLTSTKNQPNQNNAISCLSGEDPAEQLPLYANNDGTRKESPVPKGGWFTEDKKKDCCMDPCQSPACFDLGFCTYGKKVKNDL
jgi:hypothetical protein